MAGLLGIKLINTGSNRVGTQCKRCTRQVKYLVHTTKDNLICRRCFDEIAQGQLGFRISDYSKEIIDKKHISMLELAHYVERNEIQNWDTVEGFYNILEEKKREGTTFYTKQADGKVTIHLCGNQLQVLSVGRKSSLNYLLWSLFLYSLYYEVNGVSN